MYNLSCLRLGIFDVKYKQILLKENKCQNGVVNTNHMVAIKSYEKIDEI